MNDAIFTRINKLLAIQEHRGATEAEASIAAEHVQRLLQEHNLTLAQVESAGGGTDEASARRENKVTARRAMYNYQQMLMAALAQNNFCLHRISAVFETTWGTKCKLVDGEIRQGHYEKRHTLVGRVVNVRVTEQTYDYLIDALKYQATEAGFPLNKLTRELFWFYEGAATRLQERLNERRREQEAASRRATAAAPSNGSHQELVLADVYGSEADLNNDALNGFPPGTTVARRLESQRKEAERTAREAELVASGVEATKAFYLSHGYGDEDAARYANSWNSRRSSQRGGRGRFHSWTQNDDAKYRKVNSAAYQAGRAAGDSIGLEAQMGRTARKALPKDVG